MFTIDKDLHEYASEWLAIAAARRWMLTTCRSVTIFKDGEHHRLLRY